MCGKSATASNLFATQSAGVATRVFGFNPSTVSAGPGGGTSPNNPINGTVTINGKQPKADYIIVFDGIVANVNGIKGDSWSSIIFNASGFAGLTGASHWKTDGI